MQSWKTTGASSFPGLQQNTFLPACDNVPYHRPTSPTLADELRNVKPSKCNQIQEVMNTSSTNWKILRILQLGLFRTFRADFKTLLGQKFNSLSASIFNPFGATSIWILFQLQLFAASNLAPSSAAWAVWGGCHAGKVFEELRLTIWLKGVGICFGLLLGG